MHQNFDLDTLKHEIALQLHQDAYFFSSQNIERYLNFGFLIMRFCLLLLQYFNFRFNLSILFVYCRSCDDKHADYQYVYRTECRKGVSF